MSVLCIGSIYLIAMIKGNETTTRDKKQLFFWPPPSITEPSQIYQYVWNPNVYSTSAKGFNVSGRFFGLATAIGSLAVSPLIEAATQITNPYQNVASFQTAAQLQIPVSTQAITIPQTSQTFTNPTSCPTNDCSKCTFPPCVCPLCAGTTQDATLVITVEKNTDCINSLPGATNYAKCRKATAAPSGTISVVFANTGVITPQIMSTGSTAFITIMTTCPNNQVTLKCESLPRRYQITTQSTTIRSDDPNNTATETTFMHIEVLQNTGGTPETTAPAATIKCKWIASP